MKVFFWYTRVAWKVSDLAYNRRETQDKRLLGRNPDRSRCHLHTSLKLFGRSIRVRWKVLGLANNRRETQDKRLLGRNPNRSLCHLHSSLKLFGRSPWLHGHRPQHTLPLSPWTHGLQSRRFYRSVVVIPAPVRVLTQRPFVPSFTSVVG